MPTIEVLFDDLERLVGVKLPRSEEELNDILSYVKGEVELLQGNDLKIEIKDGNRPDIWNVEGIARELRGALEVELGLREYRVEAGSGARIDVDPTLEHIRPYIAAAIIMDVKLNDEIIREAMHLQDKLDQTYGRRRSRASIGLYNFDLITPPLKYTTSVPPGISFVPLGFSEEMTLQEILEKHPKGVEYGHIVRKFDRWPLLVDSKNRVLSFPPIINSNDLGRLTAETRNVLIEVTGTIHETVTNTLTIVALSLADRGGRIYSELISYPYGPTKEEETPKLERQTVTIDTGYANKILGLNLTSAEIARLLQRARYGVPRVDGNRLTVQIPCYRIDMMHPMDVIEDAAIMYGFNRIKPRMPHLVTVGGVSPKEGFVDLVREIMAGEGFQEVLTFTMNNPENLFTKMNLERQEIIEVANPKSLTYTCLRSWVIPSLMEFLSNNTHVEYPQKVYEVSDCVTVGDGETRTETSTNLACLSTHARANFTEVKAILDTLLLNLGRRYTLVETRHQSFIEGRVGKVMANRKRIGIVGEISPRVLEMWGLENPVAGFEISLSAFLPRK